ncbi:ACP S-malonyltransferase [Alteromonas sp. ASW11-130]|uniref:ACP S-malonyltransferase n=1 Tax=Alteromonas sp. ASW11-130 TaxID=3015775 RepID=UPI00224250F1|nr:ACP S-malonyltransferase [Alteromonas sp. ASW11-130]MCW8092013.1 ACP S-malonyltransferase [Alteromonas sp. ASW11-130]
MTMTACVFPGQGSQSKGMLSDLAQAHSVVKDTFNQASEVLGYDLWATVQEDAEHKLDETQVTQPAILTASVAVWRTINPDLSQFKFLAGHSLGEYSALVCSGAMEFEDAVKLVEMRGNYMQQAVPAGTGAMYAIIGLDDDKIAQICQQIASETGNIISPVNFNSPGQVVIAGEKSAAELAGNACKEAGAKRALPLAVSVPSHCDLMRPAAEKLEQALQTTEIKTPKIAVINNVDVVIETQPDAIKNALVRQLYCPVQWTRTVKYMASNGVAKLLEVGPGKVLTGLTKRIDKSLEATAINTPELIAEL